MAIEIVDLPSYKMVDLSIVTSVYQRVSILYLSAIKELLDFTHNLNHGNSIHDTAIDYIWSYNIMYILHTYTQLCVYVHSWCSLKCLKEDIAIQPCIGGVDPWFPLSFTSPKKDLTIEM